MAKRRVAAVIEADSKTRFLDAAIAMLDGGGEAALRIDELAKQVGVAKTSLYHHFGDREGLIVAAQAERYRRSILIGIDETLAAVESCETKEQFLSIFPALVDAWSDEEGKARRRMRVEVLGSSVSRERLRTAIIEATHAVAEDVAMVIRAGQRRGWIAPEHDAYLFSSWLIGHMNSRYLAEISGDDARMKSWNDYTKVMFESMLVSKPLR